MCDFVHCNYQFDAVFICVFSSAQWEFWGTAAAYL